MSGQVGRGRLTPTPLARAIAAVSAPATRIARARAILGSVMSGLSALMLVRIGGERGVGDRVSRSALHAPSFPDLIRDPEIMKRCDSGSGPRPSPGKRRGGASSIRHPGLEPGSGAGVSAIRPERFRSIPARCASAMTAGAGQAGRWRVTVTPQARAISAVSAHACHIARPWAILGLDPRSVGGVNIIHTDCVWMILESQN